MRIVKRFGELLKKGPSERDVATSDAGTQTICLIQSSSTQTATCSPRFKALQQQNSSHKSQSQQSASHQNQSISTQSSSSVSNSEPFGVILVKVDMYGNYPVRPPTMTILSKVHHPNVYKDGRVCMRLPFCYPSPDEPFASGFLRFHSLGYFLPNLFAGYPVCRD